MSFNKPQYGNLYSTKNHEHDEYSKTDHRHDGIYGTITQIEEIIATKVDVEDLKATNAEIENLKVGKAEIDDLKATNAEIENLKATNVEISGKLTANEADIKTLRVEKASIEELEAVYGKINYLEAGKADIVDLEATNATIKNLEADVAKIGKLEADVADIDHILAGNITADMIQAGTITAGSGIIADGAIGSAQISTLDAGKISAGKLDTSLVEIAGADGHLKLKGNRMQVFQGVGAQAVERVSLGDVNADGTVYGLRVRGRDGKTVLLDEDGVKPEGITDGSITNDKISDSAGISGEKLNINSVVDKINDDGTTSIKGTKVLLEDGSLEVKLSSITEKQDIHTDQITQAYTKIEANEREISLKVNEQIYTEDKKENTKKFETIGSDITAMKDSISLKVEQADIDQAVSGFEGKIDEKITTAKGEIKVTTDEIKQSVSKIQTEVTNKADGSVVEDINSRLGELTVTTDSIKGEVSEVKKTTETLATDVDGVVKEIDEVSSTVSTLTTDLQGITQRVSNTESTTTSLGKEIKDVDKKVDDIEIGGRNLLRNTALKLDSGYFALDTGVTRNTVRKTPNNNNCFEFNVSGLTASEYRWASQIYKNPMIGKQYTFSVYAFVPSNHGIDVSARLEVICLDVNGTRTGTFSTPITASVTEEWQKVFKTFVVPIKTTDIRIGTYITQNGRFYTGDYLFEEGNKRGAWSPSPEDVSDSIDNITDDLKELESEYTKTKTQVSEIVTEVGSITSRVSSVESTTSKIDGKVVDLTTRMSTAEQKIHPDKIVSVVKEHKTDGKNTFAQQSDITQLNDSWTAKFSSSSGYNLLYNGDFKDGFRQWKLTGKPVIANGVTCKDNQTAVKMTGKLNETVIVAQNVYDLNYEGQLVLSQWSHLTDGTNGTTNPYIGTQVTVEYTDGTRAYPGLSTPDKINKWTRQTVVITPPTGKRIKNLYVGLYCRDTTRSYYVTDIIISKGNTEVPFSRNPNEIYDGVTTIDKSGVTVTASNVKSKTQMNADGFKIIKTDNGQEVFKVNADGTLIFIGNISGSTFSSINNIFTVGEDGKVETDELSVNDTISTDILNVNEISNPEYPKSLEGTTQVYINPSASEFSAIFEDGGTYRSVAEVEGLAPRNLNGYWLKIRLMENVTENIVLNSFYNGYLCIELNSKTLNGYIYFRGMGLNARLYGTFVGGTGGTAVGTIAPYAGYNRLSYRYAVVAEDCHLTVNDVRILKSTVTDINSGCILCTEVPHAYINNVVAVNEPYLLLRCHAMSKVYLAGSSGMTQHYSVHSISGSIVTVNSTKQAGRKGSTAHTYKTGNAQLFADGVTWDTTAQSGGGSSSGNDKVTKTVSVKSTLGDTYRTNDGWAWKKDGTVRQGSAYGSGNCNGLWFFGSSLATYLKKNVSKVTVSVKRQAGGSSAPATLYIVGHNYTSRPSGAPTMGAQIASVDAKIGETKTITLNSTEIANLKKYKGIGLKTAYNATNYSVCSGTCTIKITYTE